MGANIWEGSVIGKATQNRALVDAGRAAFLGEIRGAYRTGGDGRNIHLTTTAVVLSRTAGIFGNCAIRAGIEHLAVGTRIPDDDVVLYQSVGGATGLQVHSNHRDVGINHVMDNLRASWAGIR